MRCLTTTVALLLCLSQAAALRAQELTSPAPAASAGAASAAQKETARTWLREGYELYERKQFAAALERFSAAYRLVRVPTTGLALTRAQESVGQWVEANATAMEVINMARAPDEPEVFGQARADARALSDRLSRVVPSVRIELLPRDVGARVSIDGAEMLGADAGMPLKLNPGEHRLLVTAPGRVAVERSFRLLEGAREQLSVTLAEDPNAALAAPTSGGAAVVVAPVDEPRDAGSAARTRGYVALGVAGVAGLAGGVTGLLAFSSKPDCPGDRCSLAQKGDADTSKRYGNIATVSFGVAAAAGAYALWELLVNAPSEPSLEPGVALPRLLPARSGVLLEMSGTL
jgi:hypothetical protein